VIFAINVIIFHSNNLTVKFGNMTLLNIKITQETFGFLEKYSLDNENSKILVGFSGGIDSACLLDVLHNLSEKYKFKLIAAHLNHNWRGNESKNEELNAKKFCEHRNIEFYSETLAENLPKTEEEARKQRYIFFNKIAFVTNSTAIFTAHTRSDQTETIIYRIIKGTGVSGLKGIPEVRFQKDNPPIYRPLLDISREETIKYCEENNICPNIDSSNLEEKYFRNKIRLSLLPELKQYNSGIENSLLRLSSVAKETEDIVEEYLFAINKEIYMQDNIISADRFLKLSASLQKRVLYDLLVKNEIDYSFEKISEIYEFILDSSGLKSGNTLSLGKKLWLFASSSEIRIITQITADKITDVVPVNMDRENFFPALHKTLKIKEWGNRTSIKFPKETETKAYVDLSKIKFPLFLRTRRDGDRIQPFGMKNKIKLKNYLINKGIPEFKRDELLLLTDEKEILWIVGISLSELLRADNIPTHVLEIY